MPNLSEPGARVAPIPPGLIARAGQAVRYLIWLVRMEGEQLNERLNRIEAAIATASQVAQGASARGDVNAVRLTTLDDANAELWRALNANAVRLDDHEHRISELEGARRR
jgi:hypothetical protein